MGNRPEAKPDVEHLRWAIEQRAKIQHTLLALYELVRSSKPYSDYTEVYDWLLLDHLIAAAFSFWRAVFLAETPRTGETIHKAQKEFLAKVVSTNAISFPDDLRASAWTVSYYLENAKHRLAAGAYIAATHKGYKDQDKILGYLRLRGTNNVGFNRYEWEAAHTALRMLFKVRHPEMNLPIEEPTLSQDPVWHFSADISQAEEPK